MPPRSSATQVSVAVYSWRYSRPFRQPSKTVVSCANNSSVLLIETRCRVSNQRILERRASTHRMLVKRLPRLVVGLQKRRERKEWKRITVQVITQVKHARESGARGQLFVPRSVRLLRTDQVLDPLS